MDPNIVIIILLVVAAVLVALLIILRPWYVRQTTEKELKDEAKYNRVKEQAAERVASKFEKKGRL